MKFSTSKNELQNALQKLSKATPSRSTLPILNSVLIHVSEEETTVKSTDLEITVIVKLAASIESVGSVAAPLQMLSNITNELPDEMRVEFDVNSENKISISTEYGNYDIVGKPAEEFPNTPTLETENTIEVEAGVLKDIINTLQSNMSLIAMNQKQLFDNKSKYDYCEIHPGLIFSILGNVVPALHMNQAPRNQFSTAHGKQCLGMYATNYRNRMDNKGQIVYYPQKPIISSTMGKYLYSNVMAKGCNVVMAVGCYSGYNQEDSIIFNKSSLERGLFRTTVFRTYNDSENVENGKVTEKIELFNPNEVSNLVPGNYNKLDQNGIVKEGVKVYESDNIS